GDRPDRRSAHVDAVAFAHDRAELARYAPVDPNFAARDKLVGPATRRNTGLRDVLVEPHSHRSTSTHVRSSFPQHVPVSDRMMSAGRTGGALLQSLLTRATRRECRAQDVRGIRV